MQGRGARTWFHSCCQWWIKLKLKIASEKNWNTIEHIEKEEQKENIKGKRRSRQHKARSQKQDYKAKQMVIIKKSLLWFFIAWMLSEKAGCETACNFTLCNMFSHDIARQLSVGIMNIHFRIPDPDFNSPSMNYQLSDLQSTIKPTMFQFPL
jgi:hypothetical protein